MSPDQDNKSSDLRQRAEQKFNKQVSALEDQLSEHETKRLLEELQIHQIELEMQNEELRESRAAAEDSRARFVDLYDFAPVGYITVSDQGYILEANLRATTMLGETRDRLVTGSFNRFIFPQDLAIYYDHLSQVFTGGEHSCELQLMTADGRSFWAQLESSATKHMDGTKVCLTMMSDITDRKQVAENERASKAFLDKILNNLGDPVFVKDDQHRFILVNDALCYILGMPRGEIIGKTLAENLPSDEMEHFLKIDKQVLKDGREDTCEETLTIRGRKTLTILTKKTRYVAENGDKFLVGVIRDMTERKEVEEEHKKLTTQLHQSQKMESIGTLAGGIAHDFNNILSSVLGFSGLALDAVEKETAIAEDIQEVYTAGLRAKDLVDQILTFARQSEEKLKPIQIDFIIKEVLKFIRSSIPTSIDIKQDINSDSLIMASATQIHRIIMNLSTNAAHAMEDEGGILKISLKDKTIDGTTHQEQISLKFGNYLQIKVSDTGVGIEPHIIKRIFDPYFTTKGPGDGTGMGLAMVHGIVETYGGKVFVESRLGKGTVFTIYLPVARASKTHQQYKVEQLPTGQERILFVDDEAQIARMASRILGQLGYFVTAKTNSLEALELFRSKPNDFDLVISDVTMPKMTGDQLTKKLIEIRSDIPVILCTGYSKRLSEEKVSEIGIKALAYKPIVKEDFAKTVRDVLDLAKD